MPTSSAPVEAQAAQNDALIGIGHAVLAGVEVLERISKQLETISADVGDLRRTVER
jgi:hypothetical protein